MNTKTFARLHLQDIPITQFDNKMAFKLSPYLVPRDL
jgi:hypothetical protein